MNAPIRSDFLSCGERCAADLYLPASHLRPPIVVMAHGFAAERRFGLAPFAKRFVKHGMAVLVFDYRGFGESGGRLRRLVSPRRHLEDWQTAIAYARNLPQVDGSRLALWGSSYGGGHVIVIAAQTAGVSAIVVQVPHVDASATLHRLGICYILQAIPHIVVDLLSACLGLPPHTVKVVGKDGEFAAMNTPDAYAGYTGLVPQGTAWLNRVPARSLLSFAFYRPIRFAARVACPALVMAGEKDTLIPIQAVRETARKMENATLVCYPIGHFDIYRGEQYKTASVRQAEFLKTHLGL